MTDKSKQEDEMLQLLGQELSEARFHEMNGADPEQETHRTPVAPKTSRKPQKRILKACCIILCVLVGATIITTVSSEAFRMKVFGFFFEKSEDHIDLVPSTQSSILYPSYLPSGYEKTAEDNFGSSIELTYENKKISDILTIFQESKEEYQQSVDSETTIQEKCLVGSYEAYYFYEKGADAMHTLIWQRDDLVIELVSTLDKDEMIKIGSSLK